MSNRVVAITGAGGTLGAALSRRFASEPDTDLVLSDLDEASLAPSSLEGLPDSVETVPADVGDFAAVEAVVARGSSGSAGSTS